MPLKSLWILQELLVTFSCLRRGNPIKRFSINTPRSLKSKWEEMTMQIKIWPVRAVGQGAPAGAFPVGQRKSQVLPLTGGIVAPVELNENTCFTVMKLVKYSKQCVFTSYVYCPKSKYCFTFVVPFLRIEAIKQVILCEVPKSMHIFNLLHGGENIPAILNDTFAACFRK